MSKARKIVGFVVGVLPEFRDTKEKVFTVVGLVVGVLTALAVFFLTSI